MAETAPNVPHVPLSKGQPRLGFTSGNPDFISSGKGTGMDWDGLEWIGIDWDGLGVLGCWVGGQVLPKLMLRRCPSLNIIPSF